VLQCPVIRHPLPVLVDKTVTRVAATQSSLPPTQLLSATQQHEGSACILPSPNVPAPRATTSEQVAGTLSLAAFAKNFPDDVPVLAPFQVTAVMGQQATLGSLDPSTTHSLISHSFVRQLSSHTHSKIVALTRHTVQVGGQDVPVVATINLWLKIAPRDIRYRQSSSGPFR
jgi:hypothetical protein